MSFLIRLLELLKPLWLLLGASKPLGDTGALLDHPEELEKLPRHELFAGGAEPKDWRTHCPPFRYQGSSMWCTAFAGASIASIFNHVEKGETTVFSPLELFYRSNGQIYGNYLINVGNAMKSYVVLEREVPTPIPTSWGQSEYEMYRAKATAAQAAIDYGKQFAVKDIAIVKTDTASLRQALASSPLYVAIGIGRGYFNDPAPAQTSYNSYHAVVLTHIEEDGTKHIFDSLTQRQGFSGHHTLAPDYEILTAFSFIDLPNDWQDIQSQEKSAKLADALSHYGKTRVLQSEQDAAKLLAEAVKRNPTIAGLMGRDWTICINAVAYGGFSVQDLLNHYTQIRRGKGPIWDLNKERNNQTFTSTWNAIH